MKSKLVVLFFILSFVGLVNSYAQLSQKHYIPPLTYAGEGNANPEDQFIYISTPSNQPINFTIRQVGSTNDITGQVSRETPQEIPIGTGNTQLFVASNETSTVHSDKGYIIEAIGGQIYVSVRVRAGGSAQAGALVSKGTAALGRVFRAGMFTNGNPQSNYLNFISVMATEDNTKVNFGDLPNGIVLENSNEANAIPEITLNEGESYIVATNAAINTVNQDALIGTLIEADKNIVVNTGSANGSFGTGGGRDYGLDQIVDVTKVGTEYIFVRGSGNDEWENILIVAHEDNTRVSVGGNTFGTIDSGDFVVIEGNNYSSNDNMYVETSKPVFAYQGIGGLGNNGAPSEANQGMFFVPPLSCESRGNVDNIAQIDQIGNTTFDGGVTIVTNTNASILINGTNINSFNPDGPNTVEGTPNYVTYKVTGLTGNVSVASSEELYCAYFNQNGAATSGSFYSGFLTAPEVDFNTQVVALGSCIPNVTLEASNTDLFDSFRWEYFNENTREWELRSTNNAYTPIESEPGRYRLVGNIDCNPDEDFISAEIPISICPDDFDGDLIIDNIDVDLDNDGILNCNESFGNVTIDLSDINNGIALNPENSANVINSSSYSSSETESSFMGDAAGNFTSTLVNAPLTEANYQLNFTENVNIIFTQNATESHTTTNGEYFIVKIQPNDKNITLLDPDDQLLINTSFDVNQEFQEGITRISGSEIWFKYKANVTAGNSTFKFVANNINQINFQHRSTGISSNSTFFGNLMLTCFAKDSDGDGVEDALDLDSDNDGIVDFLESIAIDGITLLNTDADEDGLDDVFDTITPNQDTDNDGIPNYLDLDSDNDGVYDLIESGLNTNLDANNDGIIDDANTNSGTNGLFNPIEDPEDSGILNFTINNTDQTSEVIENRDNLFDFVDLDADGDDCFDVTEAGFTGNGAGVLAPNPLDVDVNGRVNNSDGYIVPNSDYNTSAPIIINAFQDTSICENSNGIITIDTNADGFQWETSTDGTIWNPLNDDNIFAGTTTNTLQITNTPATLNNTQFRVILTRIGNSCPKTSNLSILTVLPLPNILNNPSNLQQCISSANANPTVNLTNAEVNISNTPNLTFEYYLDAAATSRITEPTSYPVTVNTTETVFVRVISNQGCFSGVVQLNVDVAQVADNPYNNLQPPVCDDFLQADGTDGPNNSDTDNITTFMLDQTSIENAINAPANTAITYYENIQDRANTLNEINITNFRNDITKNDVTNINNGIQFPIYYRISSTLTNDCAGLGQFIVQINSVPRVSSDVLTPIEECDDGEIDGNQNNGRNSGIDLTIKIAEVLSGTGQNTSDFPITFYKSQSAAFMGDTNSNEFISNPNDYTNDVPPSFIPGERVTQTIYLRIENNATGCFNANVSFDIIINPAPVIPDVVTPLEVCDAGTNDGSTRNGLAQNIDVSVKDIELTGTASAANFIVTYHKTVSDLQNLSSTGIDKFSYQSDINRVTINPTTSVSQENLFVRIVNTNTGCVFDEGEITIIVNPEPTNEVISNLSVCDDNNDGDDTNGIVQNIDLNGKIPEILGSNQDPDNFTVSFHLNAADASTGFNRLPSPYQNLNPTETIFVRIQNTNTSCVNDDATFQIIVNSLPDFTVTSPQILCLNDVPLQIFVENPTDIYDYSWKDNLGNEISTSEFADISEEGIYTVSATTTNGTACTRVREVEIIASNPAILNESFITIIDDTNNIGADDQIAISINTTNNNLGIGDYQFAIRNNDTNTRIPFAGFQEEPLFENIEGGIYTVIVNDKNGCVPDATLEISVIQFPKFFTPNGDNRNDTWTIKGANETFFPNSSINIFNRYGQLMAKVPINSQGWDGTYNGKLLPTDDYWFNVQLIPADTTKPPILKRGHFSLLRR